MYPKMTDEIMDEIADILENAPKSIAPVPAPRGMMTMNHAVVNGAWNGLPIGHVLPNGA
jgi:hypothetical protein